MAGVEGADKFEDFGGVPQKVLEVFRRCVLGEGGAVVENLLQRFFV